MNDPFPGFPVGETKEAFEAALDRLMEWRARQPDPLPQRLRKGHLVLACPRVPVRGLLHFLPAKFIEALEQNQKIAHCCRHPENHTIEAWFSCREEEANGTPDVYINHCTCGRKHVRFCCGGSERPVWEASR